MKTKLKINVIIFMVAVSLVFVGSAFAKASISVEGKIQGANCVITKKPCPLNGADPHVSMERDFVLVTETGEYLFLPNLSRSIKIKYVNENVRITGEKKGNVIVVANVDGKKAGNYESVWNWKKKVNAMNRGN
jgi:hypothetical protein